MAGPAAGDDLGPAVTVEVAATRSSTATPPSIGGRGGRRRAASEPGFGDRRRRRPALWGSPGPGVGVALADEDLVVAVAVEVDAPDGVAPLHRLVDDPAVPGALAGLRRRVDDDLEPVPGLDRREVPHRPPRSRPTLTSLAPLLGLSSPGSPSPSFFLRPVALVANRFRGRTPPPRRRGRPRPCRRRRGRSVGGCGRCGASRRPPRSAIPPGRGRRGPSRTRIRQPLPSTPVGPLGPAPLERRDDQLRPPVPSDVAEADPVQGRLGPERDDPPGTLRPPRSGSGAWSVPPVFRVRVGCQEAPRAKSTRPSPSRSRPGGRRCPSRCLPSDRCRACPPGIFVPDDRVVGHGDDVELAVAIDVGQGHGVADFAPTRWGRSPVSPELRKTGRRRDKGRSPGSRRGKIKARTACDASGSLDRDKVQTIRFEAGPPPRTTWRSAWGSASGSGNRPGRSRTAWSYPSAHSKLSSKDQRKYPRTSYPSAIARWTRDQVIPEVFAAVEVEDLARPA